MDSSWSDQSAAWWAKAARARTHISAIASMVAAFEAATAYQIRMEHTDEPGRVAFRLHLLKPVPVDLLTTIGDALHNLRSCLDSVAFELARRHLGNAMTEKQQGSSQFPICRDRTQFDEFLARRDQRDLYGEDERNALLCVQPFALHDEAAASGVELATSVGDEYRISELARLHHLSIRDKHRRLPLLAWYPEFVYLTEDVGQLRWSQPQRESPGLQDNDVIGYLTYTGSSDPSSAMNFEMRLALAEDPGYAGDVVKILEGWHSSLINWMPAGDCAGQPLNRVFERHKMARSSFS